LDKNTEKTAFFAGTGTLGPNGSVRLSPFDISQISDHFLSQKFDINRDILRPKFIIANI